jgi:NAD/NADP transhydrogenase beta subunit
MQRNLGLLVAVAGMLIVLLGVLVWAGGLMWFGRLPGDIRIERGNVRIYIPLVSMLLVSVVATILLWIVRCLFRR